MDQFSPFTIPQSPAINSMPPPSFAPPSLPPPPSTSDQHSSHHSNSGANGYSSREGQNSDIKPGVSGTLSNPASQNALSFSASMLTMPTPLTQGPGTPLNLGSSTADSHLQPTLQNIVSTVNLGCQLELKKIALYARNAEYNPKRFAAVIMRIRSPRTTALIFSSGKMVCTGAKSEDDSRLAARKYARIIQKLGFAAKFMDFKIQNIVGSIDVGFCLRLECFHTCHSQFCSYEPELFPGLIYRLHEPKVVLLIFVSGKVVITGAKLRTEINEAFEKIYPILKNFKKV